MDPSRLHLELKKEIETGALLPGTPLRQEEIAGRFGVSRQPVRQAFDRLVAEGLVARRSDRTLIVVSVSAQEAAEIVSVRTLLESEALRLAFDHLDERTLKRARRVTTDLADEDEPARMEELDVAFHAVLYGACKNNKLLRLIESLRREGRRAYHSQPQCSANRRRYVEEHAALLKACEARDLPQALAVLARHLLSSAQD